MRDGEREISWAPAGRQRRWLFPWGHLLLLGRQGRGVLSWAREGEGGTGPRRGSAEAGGDRGPRLRGGRRRQVSPHCPLPSPRFLQQGQWAVPTPEPPPAPAAGSGTAGPRGPSRAHRWGRPGGGKGGRDRAPVPRGARCRPVRRGAPQGPGACSHPDGRGPLLPAPEPECLPEPAAQAPSLVFAPLMYICCGKTGSTEP